MENEVNKSSFVDLSWDNLDIEVIANKVKYIWKKRKEYFNKSREEYFKIISWKIWEEKWKQLIK